jgi:hypothetical protein
MALNPSGVMSIGGTTVGASINLELKLSATANSSIGQANFRELAKVPTGAISLSDFYGKSSVVEIVISENRTQYTLSPSEVPGYLAGETEVQLRIDDDVYLYSTDVNAPALTVIGFVAGDTITIVNGGYILGKGGQGAVIDAYVFNPSVLPALIAESAGPAISIFYPVTIENNRYICGGGGGGAVGVYGGPGGGGAGGGKGGNIGGLGYDGGAGGGPGMAGQDGLAVYYSDGSGGGGGRIVPGIGGAGGKRTDMGGTTNGKGGGSGGGGAARQEEPDWPEGGNGGTGNSPGQTLQAGGGGGGWGAAGGPSGNPSGAGGKAVALNGNTLTRFGSGLYYGAVS